MCWAKTLRFLGGAFGSISELRFPDISAYLGRTTSDGKEIKAPEPEHAIKQPLPSHDFFGYADSIVFCRQDATQLCLHLLDEHPG